jgi:hypothetical protein
MPKSWESIESGVYPDIFHKIPKLENEPVNHGITGDAKWGYNGEFMDFNQPI